jgi:hypothetical protein
MWISRLANFRPDEVRFVVTSLDALRSEQLEAFVSSGDSFLSGAGVRNPVLGVYRPVASAVPEPFLSAWRLRARDFTLYGLELR